MSDPISSASQATNIPPSGCEVKDATVNLIGVDGGLMAYVGKLGLIHLHIFGAPLVITSGKDSLHGTGSKHYEGKAVDVRMQDLDKQGRVTLTVAAYQLTDQFNVSLFIERDGNGVEHLHCECAG